MAALKQGVHDKCVRLCRVAMRGTAAELKEAMEQLNAKVSYVLIYFLLPYCFDYLFKIKTKCFFIFQIE